MRTDEKPDTTPPPPLPVPLFFILSFHRQTFADSQM
jgi:hypothetical protein